MPGTLAAYRMTFEGQRNETWKRAGVPRKVAMALVGHQTEAMYRRYDIVTDADLHAAAAKLNASAGA